jgi:ATP-binding cassette, subfamily B, multidrug efflux pump
LKELLTLNRYFSSYKKEVVWGTVFLTVSNAFLVWIPILIRQSIDRVEQITKAEGLDWSGVWQILAISEYRLVLLEYPAYLFLASIVYGYLLFATRQYLIVASRHIEYDMRNEIFDHLQKLPQSFYARTNSGDVYVKATEDINRVRDYFGPAYMYTINTITRAGIILAIMFMVNVELTLWALLPLPLLSIIAYYVSTYINKRSTEIQEQYAMLAGRAQEAFSSIRIIKAYVREEYESGRFRNESEKYRDTKLKLGIVESLFYPLLNLLIGFSTLFVVWKGGELVMQGTITIGNIAEYVIYVTYLTWPVAALGYTLNLLQRSAASQKRLADLLAEPIEIESDNAIELDPSTAGDITFDKVSFKYPGSESYALREINLRIKAGSKVAFVGRTGSGKTSLIQLIPRLFEPTEGYIYIGERNIRQFSLHSLRRYIGIVPQESFLFSDTIAENIAFGVDKATQESIEEAAKNAQLLETINDFDKKFMTVLGERGITLSGGQKQRTSIARAIIKKPGILILDDSLSAVDSKTEDNLTRVLKDNLPGTTTIMIAHRLSSVKHCDTIYVLDNGRIVEEGNHDMLINKSGAYASLHKKQLIEQELAAL